MRYYSGMKNNCVLIHAETWTNLKIMLDLVQDGDLKASEVTLHGHIKSTASSKIITPKRNPETSWMTPAHQVNHNKKHWNGSWHTLNYLEPVKIKKAA